MNAHRLLLLAIVTLIMAGCGSKNTLPDPEPSSGSAASGSSDPLDDGTWGAGEPVPDSTMDNFGRVSELIIYFDYDKSDLRPEYADQLAGHAQRLKDNPDSQLRLEGHADERGSREYNIGLGERRSQAVRRMLLIQGASAGQISTVSFGEERPAMSGSTEQAYTKNRRVEFGLGERTARR